MKITHEQIIAAIETIAKSGESLTNDAVRNALGGIGSLTTISPVLKAWKEEQKKICTELENAPKVVTDKLSRYANDIWATAIELANARLDADRNILKQENERLSEHIRLLENDGIALGIELEGLERERAALESANKEAQEIIGVLRSEVSTTAERAHSDKIYLEIENQRNKELKDELANAIAKYDGVLKIMAASVPQKKSVD
jgi:chromosome segregation ATPase